MFSAEAREMVELLHPFEEPLILDGAKYRSALGDYPATPYAEGGGQTLERFRASDV